jgi:ubiquinone/menaquinone biosynthesis C-methylase UbiE
VHEAEFDKFAIEYRNTHASNIAVSGESPEYFAAYKVRDLARELSRMSDHLTAPRVLDFGAGVGNSAPYIMQSLPAAQLTCTDVSGESLAIAQSRFTHPSIKYVKLDGACLPFADAQFDATFSACVFHHIAPAEYGLWIGELLRVTKPGGLLMIYEHNPLNPVTRAVVRECPFDENAILIGARELRGHLEAAGWREVRARFRVFFPRSLARARPLERFLVWLPLGAQYYVTGRRES